LIEGESFAVFGREKGKPSSPSLIGVPAKKASAIKILKEFLLSISPGFEECAALLIFIT
jgi:hypothetical protein